VNELTFKHRALLYLYSTPHLVGCVAALAGFGLYFGGIIEAGWWAIVAGLYVAGVLVTPRSDTVERLARAEFSEATLRDHLDSLIKTAKGRVPLEAGSHLESIREHAELLLPKLKELAERGALSITVHHDAVQMLTRYLPDTLNGFLRIPPAYFRLHPDESIAAEKELLEQLGLLEDNFARAVKEAFAEDVATLQVQGRFLTEKFTLAPQG
jgi:hypothetical protein